MKISLWPNSSRPVSEILAEARWAVDAGWHGVWVADHYMPNTGTEERADGDYHEAWALLPALAAVTERVRIGVLVSPTTVHHPALLAKRAATIDHLSDGRMVLGMGAGWQINEHAAYGFDLLPARERVDRFEEAIRIVNSLLTEDRTTYDGKHFQLDDAPANPKPVQAKLPILVGTAGPRMLRITARHADEWNSWGGPETAIPKLSLLQTACDAVGRDFGSMWKSSNIMFDVAGKRPAAPGRGITGSPEQLRDAFGRLAEAGFDELILPSWNLGDSLSERLDALAEIETDVLRSA
ncbi:LLM class flavin-dependent oxidoreductase [Nocardioides sp. Kera G14]|uniref:LLM class flavin-dependent oxidoreductase n=1 Tax=Nocardioides sp. Kera G14 TaxID=2884264 RepID=UPI001D104A69|nr:LLM class flavin-dependent oxidoreductase [Nocardioides sp. Kera G14]UDY23538.1 LLM class flavin-dependent oxidoreductase [Nocardioides sp. Kera G14]